MAVHAADDVALFYTDEGSGRVALLLHGWACDSHDWSWLIPDLLQQGFRVIALDHRGHGRSTAPAGGYTPRQMAADAASLLDAIAISEALVVGHSMGTIVASVLSIDRPDLVSGLVLVDPVYNRPDENLAPVVELVRQDDPRPGVATAFRNAFYTPDAPAWLMMWHERRVLGTPVHVVRDSFLGLYESEDAPGRSGIALEYLRGRKAPRLAVYASEELTWLERRLPSGPGDEIAVIEGGHWLHQERASELSERLREWLERAGDHSASV